MSLPAEKSCPRCGVVKSAAEFYVLRGKMPNGTSRIRLSSYCKTCQRSWITAQNYTKTPEQSASASRRQQLRKYGLTPDSYEQMFLAQGGVCAICQNPPQKNRLAVDHDHETDAIRALLCASCNAGIGLFRDDPDLLAKAITYLCLHHQQKLRAVE